MACGFFIACIPCIPKILQDTGVFHQVKKAFGLTKTKSNKPGDYYGTGPSAHSRVATTTSNAYYKLDEDGIPMDNIKTESTENLNDPKPSTGIIRTTRITVNMQDNSSVSDQTSNDVHMNSKAAWGR